MTSPEKKQSEQKDFDPFLLNSLYPNPSAVFSERPPSVASFQEDCIFFLDTNVLLAPYSFGDEQQSDIASIYQNLAKEGRLFIAERVAQEFAHNRHEMLKKLFDRIVTWKKPLDGLSAPRHHASPMLEGKDTYKEMVAAAEDIWKVKQRYEKSLNAVLDDLSKWDWDDPISTLYSELFLPERIIGHHVEDKDVLTRLQYMKTHCIPPGYKDASKEDQGIGDYLIWLSMKQAAIDQNKHVVFVSNETKPDWVVKVQKVVLSVRPELFYEFLNDTTQKFGLSSFAQFLELQKAQKNTVKSAKESAMSAIGTLNEIEVLSVLSQLSQMAISIEESELIVEDRSRLANNLIKIYETMSDWLWAYNTNSFVGKNDKELSRLVYNVGVLANAVASFEYGDILDSEYFAQRERISDLCKSVLHDISYLRM